MVFHSPIFSGEVEKLLSRYGVVPEPLEFEITSGPIRDLDNAKQTAAHLTRLGITLSLDAFSNQHSSLHYFKLLPFSKIKIDRSLVQQILKDDRNDLALVRSAINLGHDLNMQVIAEGVENGQTWNMLQAFGCDAAQGTYIGPPQPLDALATWLDNGAQALPASAADARKARNGLFSQLQKKLAGNMRK
jgi:EAL domain-containing protein (putative c-di-GMP-specific phosphodiesterase class I)